MMAGEPDGWQVQCGFAPTSTPPFQSNNRGSDRCGTSRHSGTHTNARARTPTHTHARPHEHTHKRPPKARLPKGGGAFPIWGGRLPDLGGAPSRFGGGVEAPQRTFFTITSCRYMPGCDSSDRMSSPIRLVVWGQVPHSTCGTPAAPPPCSSSGQEGSPVCAASRGERRGVRDVAEGGESNQKKGPRSPKGACRPDGELKPRGDRPVGGVAGVRAGGWTEGGSRVAVRAA